MSAARLLVVAVGLAGTPAMAGQTPLAVGATMFAQDRSSHQIGLGAVSGGRPPLNGVLRHRAAPQGDLLYAADLLAQAPDHTLDPAILALKGDVEYGEYLSGECTTCHRIDGETSEIPSIVLWPEEDFVLALHAYKNKTRAHPIMQMIAGRLGNEEIAALAAYFATQNE